MIRLIRFIIPAVFCLVIISCMDDLEKDDKYRRPDWLAGKLFDQILDQPELSTFARCLGLTGYDTIINTSGTYTVFAPNDEAFSLYFDNHTEYSSIEDIPYDVLLRIVKYHIVQNPWSKTQLTSLDVFGWIDTLDIDNDEPRGFKRETLLLNEDLKFGVETKGDRIILVDTLESNWHRRVAADSRKFVPFFYNEYFNIYDLDPSDYEFYFGRTISSPDDLYFAQGKIIGDEIFAENGFVYNIDRVIDPLPNAYQVLSKEEGGNESYNEFLTVIEYFPEFTYNERKTFDQPGAEQGYAVDSIFEITFPDLVFDVTNENTSPPEGTYGLPGNVTIRYHHGLVAPTNAAFNAFVDKYLMGGGTWGGIENTPDHIRRIIANTHMCINPIYPTDFQKGFYNGERDLITLDEADIVYKQFGSNCTFIGMDKTIVPRAFKSVAYPAYLKKAYSKVMWAVENTGLLSALNREEENYLFYMESNANSSLDSSLFYEPVTNSFSTIQRSGMTFREFPLNTSELRTLLLNHIATGVPTGAARKEFFKNLAGNFIIINNETGEVRGTDRTTDGYKGSEKVTVIPSPVATDADNGIVYDIEDWFSFTSSSLFTKISGTFPAFHDLLQKAGLSNDLLFRYNFISENEFYTVFVPTQEAIDSSGADTLSTEELRKFVLMHFVQGDFIFTDGNKPPGYYETARIDEKSTQFSQVNTKMYIEPGIDMIIIKDKDGNDYVIINESSSSTNILAARNVGQSGGVFPNVVNTAVIHEINRALLFEEVDIR